MPNYKRWRIQGGAYFFTVVTASRRPILSTELGRRSLREAISEVSAESPFEVFAIVLLPDHFHCIWNLPEADDDFSWRWARVKTSFTKKFLAGGGDEAPISESRRKKGERGVWQRRFWEHFVRNENDLKRCLDYIHYNPVKHGLVSRVKDWPWSSFRRFVRLGEYSEDWGADYDLPYDVVLFGDDEFA
jgi:putative transposase